MILSLSDDVEVGFGCLALDHGDLNLLPTGYQMPGQELVLAWRNIQDFERPIFFVNSRKIGVRDRKKPGLHELMLVA